MMGTMGSVIGWDVGGAHLKAARAEGGVVVNVVQLPSPLWLGLDRLTEALEAALGQLGPAERHVVTMTAELADVFPDRATGVARIAAVMAERLKHVAVYAGRAGLIDPSVATENAEDIASANWHASAGLAAQFVPDGLFADIGSTTTDLVPIRGGRVATAGYSDAVRLACGELVYTGLTRTALMAVADRAPVDGAWVGVAAEYFATMADVYRVLGVLDETADQMATADGREKTVEASRARLARMVGRDAGGLGPEGWRGVAAWFAEAQMRRIMDGAALVLSRAHLPDAAPLVTAGAGVRLAERLAERLGRPCVAFATLIQATLRDEGLRDAAATCAPAVAMALIHDSMKGRSLGTPS